MRRTRLVTTLLAASALLFAVDALSQTPPPLAAVALAGARTVAVTFDDLPATPAGGVGDDVASLTALTRKLLNAVRKHHVPAVGFVNERQLFVEGAGPADVESRTGLLRM